MRIGVLADSHDNLISLRKAINLFNKEKVEFVLHAGDFIAPFSVLELEKLACPYQGVFGNNDGEKVGLIKASKGRIKEELLKIELGGKKIIVLHDLKRSALSAENCDLVIFGHTHKPETVKQGGRFLFNPGECCGWLTNKSTIGIIELNDLSAQLIEI